MSQSLLILLPGNVITTPTGLASLAAYCMLLPGKELHLSALFSAKKFQGRDYKDGAIASNLLVFAQYIHVHWCI